MKRREDQIFSPFTNPCKYSFFPGNEAASLLCHIQDIWNDICVLSKIRSNLKDTYDKKLLLKYIIIEYLSIVMHIQKFNVIIFNNKTDYKIDCNQLDELRKLFKSFFSKHKVVNNKTVSIRNKIGAHREVIDPVIINKLWEEIEPKIIIRSLNHIPQLFNFLKDLHIYVWSRAKGKETIELVFPFRIN